LSLTPGVRVGQGVDATDDLADFLGNASLAGLVGDSLVLLDEFLGVVRGRLHGLLPRRELGGSGLQEGEEDAALDVLRKEGVEDLTGGRLELVEREQLPL